MARKNPDYRDFDASVTPGKKKAKDYKADAIDTQEAGFWWKMSKEEERGETLVAAARELDLDQKIRHNQNLLHSRLYGNFDMQGFGARQYARGNVAATSKIAFNVVEAGVDTLAANISKERPRPVFIVDGARWSEQQKAKRLGWFSEAMFAEADVYNKSDMVFLDAAVGGTGGFKVFMCEGRVCVERAYPDEILVDEADSQYGSPRQLIQGKLCHREQLLEAFGDNEDVRKKILDAIPPEGVQQRGFGDMLKVYEGWHLPSSKGASDGVHCIALEDGGEIFCEEWKLKNFPFVFFRFKPKLLGFWGTGVAEILTGIQLELNRLVQSVSEQLRRKGKGRIFMPLSAKVPPEHMNNNIASIIYYNGNVPPTIDQSNAVAAEEFQQIDRLYSKAFQLIGASEMSVSAKKPAGLDAAVALREFEDISSARFVKQSQRWDNFFGELAELMLQFVREFGGPSYVSKYESKRFLETIKWSDVAVEEGAYKIKMTIASSLPRTFGARKQAIKEMMQDQFIDLPEAKKLLDIPDIQAETDLGNAAIDDVEYMIDQILTADEPDEAAVDISRYTNLDEVVKRGTAAWLYAKNHGVDEDRLDRLSGLIDAAAQKKIDVMQTPPPVPPGPPGAPGGAPGAPPPPPGGGGGPPAIQNNNTNQLNLPPAPAVAPNLS